MMFWMIGAGLGILAILFRLAALARLTIPLLYTVSMLTVFHGWYRAHTALADNILFVLVGLVILSWLFSLLGRVWSFIQEKREDRAAVEYFAYRICLEGCVIVLACVIFSAFASSPPAIADDTLAPSR